MDGGFTGLTFSLLRRAGAFRSWASAGQPLLREPGVAQDAQLTNMTIASHTAGCVFVSSSHKSLGETEILRGRPRMKGAATMMKPHGSTSAQADASRIAGLAGNLNKETRMTAGATESTQEAIMVGQMRIRYLIDGTATGGMGVFELSVPPNSNVPPPHSHTRNEECVYVLEGVLRYSVDGVERDLCPGEWMFTPRGSVHQFSNPHGEAARALIVLTPDIGAQYFRDIGSIVNAGGPPDRVKLLDVMSRYGLVPAPQKAAT